MKRLIAFCMVFLIITNVAVAQDSESIDASFANPTDLTDQQNDEAKTFVHQGVKDRIFKEGCEKLNNCQDTENGMQLESLIGKAYALVFGTMVKGLTKKPEKVEAGTDADKKVDAQKSTADTSKPDASKKKSDDDSKTDYCMYIAITYETLGTLIQSGLQKKADNSAALVNDTQLQSLVSLKQTHKARKTTATYQAAIYGSVAACYGVMAYAGGIVLDWKYWAKLGGATALAGLYVKKAMKEANAAKAVQTVMDSFPKAGDCNPWTGTSCFCAEATSKTVYPTEYQDVCVLNNGNPETPKVAMGCGTMVDGVVTYDQDCTCKATNTCIKASMAGFKASLGTGANLLNTANTGFDLLSGGTTDTAQLSSYASGAAAMASSLKPSKPVPTPKIALTPEQKAEAIALQPTLGNNAALAAASPMTSAPGGISNTGGTTSAALSKLTPAVKQKLAEGIKANYKHGGSAYNNSQSSTPDFVFPGLPGQTPPKEESTEVLSFAQQAINKADVSNAPETPIFDIISNRYRRSGWTKLQPTEK